MGGDPTRPMWVLLVLATLVAPSLTICPSRCRCNEDALRVSCARAALAVVPIQLNPEVQHIDLSHNKISSVHYTLGFYGNLISLDLSVNKILVIGAGDFEGQRSLKQLNLSCNDLAKLSKDSFKGLRVLNTLDLSRNRLEEISVHAFRDLRFIEVLKLTGNQLISLEAGLLKPASGLRQLLLDENQLLDVPSGAIADATSLQRLALSRNLIASIPDEGLPSLPELEQLELDSNVLSDIHPGALSGLIALEHLDLSNNNFTEVPTASLAKLSNLTKLKFSENFIAAVPPVAFRGLFQLRTLILSREDFLGHIDARAFVDNINLEQLWMDDNLAIDGLPSRLFYGNPRLTHISLRNNRVATLDVSHIPLDQLIRLQLGGNPFQCNCSLMWLWRLGQEQRSHSGNTSEITPSELSIDIEEIKCAGPEPLEGMLLADTYESQIGCSLGWLAVSAGIFLTFLLLAIASGVLYCFPRRNQHCRDKGDLPQMDNIAVMRPVGMTNGHLYDAYHTYEEPRTDKYIIGPSLIHDYRALPTWDPCAKHNGVYPPYDHNLTPIKQKPPHIVYV